MTETYRAGAEGQQKTSALLRTLSLLLEDLLLLGAGTPELLRNTDLRPELERLNTILDFPWIENASRGLDQVQSGMRRNLLRSLSLDAFAGQLTSQMSQPNRTTQRLDATPRTTSPTPPKFFAPAAP